MQSRQRLDTGNGKSVVTRTWMISTIKALWHDLDESIPRRGEFNLDTLMGIMASSVDTSRGSRGRSDGHSARRLKKKNENRDNCRIPACSNRRRYGFFGATWPSGVERVVYSFQ